MDWSCVGERPKKKVQKLSCAKGRYSKFSTYVACQIGDVQIFFWWKLCNIFCSRLVVKK
jgi:hypothetical protein